MSLGTTSGLAVFGTERLASVYLCTGEGLSERNETLLGHALGRLRKTGLPRVMGGDFQQRPVELQRGPSAQAAGAIITR